MEAKRSKAAIAKWVFGIIAVFLVVCLGGFAWYASDYAHADSIALAVIADENGETDGVVVRELSDKAIALVPESAHVGLVFYPGAKVQPESYAPLLEQCAERGVLCVLLRPLFNLALLDENCADGVQAQFPEIDTWIIAGHSMGGVAASDYASRHRDDYAAIVFLASYPYAYLGDFEGSALSLAGTNDDILNRAACDAAEYKLPALSVRKDIEGGNHAYFGNYGEQAGDGQASITREQQQKQTVDEIVALSQSVA